VFDVKEKKKKLSAKKLIRPQEIRSFSKIQSRPQRIESVHKILVYPQGCRIIHKDSDLSTRCWSIHRDAGPSTKIQITIIVISADNVNVSQLDAILSVFILSPCGSIRYVIVPQITVKKIEEKCVFYSYTYYFF